MRAVRALWAVTVACGFLLVGVLARRGYEADREQTGGAPGALELALILVFLLALAVALVLTVRNRRQEEFAEVRLSRRELTLGLVGLIAGVFFPPALLLVVGVVGLALWRTLRTASVPA